VSVVAFRLTDKTDDTLTTGDIYDYVIEGLSAAGTTTEVIIELTTIIPENAKKPISNLAGALGL
jgi:hypothetical protein